MVAVPGLVERVRQTHEILRSTGVIITEKERKIIERSNVGNLIETNYQRLKVGLQTKIRENSRDIISLIGYIIIDELETEEDTTKYATLRRTCEKLIREIGHEYRDLVEGLHLKCSRDRRVYELATVILAKAFVYTYLSTETN